MMTHQASALPYFLTPAQAKALRNAYKRGEPYYVCPTKGIWAAASMSLLRSLQREGYITDDGAPTLTAKGIDVAKDLAAKGA